MWGWPYLGTVCLPVSPITSPPGLLIQYDEYNPPIYCFVTSNLCDNKMISWIMPPTSHWRCDDQPWSWLWSLEMIVIHFVWILIILLIFGSEEDGALIAADLTTCSYTTAALLHKSEHYSATTPPQPQLKMIKKTLTMNSCCAPSTTTPRWCLKSCCCSRLFASSWWWISFCSAAKLNTRASLNHKPPMY